MGRDTHLDGPEPDGCFVVQGQFGSALAGARWPAITTMNILSHQLLRDPIEVIGGYHKITDSPGLGVEVGIVPTLPNT